MDNEVRAFPGRLLDWAGHRSGGVRRLFDEGSGRPSGGIIQTRLLGRLTTWVEALVNGNSETPTTVLLVGGPGNGKTDAVEVTLRHLDSSLNLRGELVRQMIPAFSPGGGRPVPRTAEIDLGPMTGGRLSLRLQVVQDASVSDPDQPGRGPADLLLSDIERAQASRNTIYLSCVNRGVLDDALIMAIDTGLASARTLLETIVNAVGLSPAAPSCWPLDGYPGVAIWPMDVESLLAAFDEGSPAPASQLLTVATNPEVWPKAGTCEAGELCPFCTSRELLSGEPHRESFLQVLRWYELATGKRWSFRDLFSLASYVLAGEPAPEGEPQEDPCVWAAKLVELQSRTTGKPDSLRLRSPYVLVASQYQHAVFGQWPRPIARSLRQNLRELRLDHDPTLLGLYYFLNSRRGLSVPATLRPQLHGICDALDPALADPDQEVAVSSRTRIQLRDVDARFSQSVREGLGFVRKYKCLTKLELNLLQRLADADDLLSSGEVRKRRPATASRVQELVRDFSCRLVRRTLGMRSAVVQDSETLRKYELVVDGDPGLLHEAVVQVGQLLNSSDRFVVTLNTTFGEPLPPEPRRAVLTTDRQRVRPLDQKANGRPVPAMRFLSVGPLSGSQSIPLTFELFRSVGQLRLGMLPASLPRTVVALLDTTRARLSGQIVRNEEMLDGAELRIGLRDEVVVREMQQFVVRGGGRG